MIAKDSLRYRPYVIIFVSLLCWSSSAVAITVDELADICQAMESAYIDISIDYTWHQDPPMTEEDIAGTGNLISIGKEHRTFTTARPFSSRSLSSYKVKLMNEHGNSFDSDSKESYNGSIAKHLSIGGWPTSITMGTITKRKDFMRISAGLTPLEFSVFHSYPDLLSEKLENTELRLCRINSQIVKINDCNSISVELVSKKWGYVYRRIYFSIDHGYAPVRFEFIKNDKVDISIDVFKFQEVSDGIWFPVKGQIKSVNRERAEIYEAKTVTLNQGLTDKDFDFEFPPGTRIVDEISGISYVFHPTEGKLNQKPTNESYPCCAMNKDRASVAAQSEAVDTNSVETILKQLKEKTEKLKSYQVQVEYKFSQPLLESETLRKGVLYYQKFDGKSKLRVNFQTLKQDDEKEQKYLEHFIFDGIWLTHIDYQIKAVKRHQLAEPNKPVGDVFDLVSRNLPIIGFTKVEELKKQFEIKLVEQKKEPPPVIPAEAGIHEFIQLNLKVKPDSIYKDDYTTIDFWIDKKLFLPAKVMAVSTEEDIYEIKFLRPKVNKKIDKKVFEFEVPEGFTVEIIPLKKKSK